MEGTTKGLRIEVYADRAGEWRWRIIARNGRKVGDSGEGYATKAGAGKAAGRFGYALRDAPVIIPEGKRGRPAAAPRARKGWGGRDVAGPVVA
jgi:uncharacterized protein YegP (UPF0339 family)